MLCKEVWWNGIVNQSVVEEKALLLYNIYITVPPFKEIEHIVAKIEEILPYCDQLIK